MQQSHFNSDTFKVNPGETLVRHHGSHVTVPLLVTGSEFGGPPVIVPYGEWVTDVPVGAGDTFEVGQVPQFTSGEASFLMATQLVIVKLDAGTAPAAAGALVAGEQRVGRR